MGAGFALYDTQDQCGNLRAVYQGRHLLDRLKDTFLCLTVAPIFSLKLRKEASSLHLLADYLRLAFAFGLKTPVGRVSIEPIQLSDELERLLVALRATSPKTILEIGTAQGGTLFLFSRIATGDATILSVDLPGGPFGGGYNAWKIPIYKSFANGRQKIHLVRGDSHSQSTLRRVQEILGGTPLDFLFIDGDHSYDGVKSDFQMYSPLVRKGGIIVFHDIVPGPRDNVGGVPWFWTEIKGKYQTREFVRDRNQGSYGIGILLVGEPYV